MKKLLALALAFSLMTACFPPAAAESRKISVIASIFPIFDWVREIVGEDENVEVSLLLSSGTDLHSFHPSVQNLVEISSCDVFIHVGGPSDDWVRDALAGAVNPELRVVSLMEVLGDEVKDEEITEGMEHHEDHDHDHDSEESEADEHVWLSLRNARRFVSVIAETLCEAAPAGAESFRANAAAYIAKLDALDARFAETVSLSPGKTVLFGDRFPFRYLTEDYGLTYYAAFSGCSAESEASFATIVFLAGKVDELNLPAVLTTETPQFRIAETIVENTRTRDQKIIGMNSMQGITADEIAAGATYLGIMEQNLAVLQEALN